MFLLIYILTAQKANTILLENRNGLSDMLDKAMLLEYKFIEAVFI